MNEFSAYIINLESRRDRRTEMERQLRLIGWHAEFFPAVRPADAGDFQTIGTRGCFLSHLGVLRRASQDKRHLVIMEDDLNFVANFQNLWSLAFRELQEKNWSIFYPGHVVKKTPVGLHQVNPSNGVWCSHFMMVHKEAINSVVEALATMMSRPGGHPLGGPMHVDAAYNLVRKQNPQLTTYLYSPSLGYQRASRSDISAHRWFDRIEPLRTVVDFLRKYKTIGTHSQREWSEPRS
jgi:glycosyl transferase, family 25